MEVIKEININQTLIYAKLLNNKKLLIVDIKSIVRIISQDDFKIYSGFKRDINYQHYQPNLVASSNNGNYFAIIDETLKEAQLINLKVKKLFSKFNRHQGEISFIIIDKLDRYMFSCGDDGKIFALDLTTGKLSFTLPMHKDRVNDLAFSDDGNWCISVSYDRKISVFNLSLMKQVNLLKIHSKPIMKVSFLDSYRVITIDKNSTAMIWNITNGDVLHKIYSLHDEISTIYATKDKKYLFLGSVLGYIMVYNLKDYQLIDDKLLKLSSTIIKIEFDYENDYLIIILKNGKIKKFYIYDGEAKVRELLQKKDYLKIEHIIETNKLLRFTSIYRRITNIWEETLKKTQDALEKGDKKRATQLVREFKKIPKKQKIIEELFQNYKNFDIFANYVKDRKISLAYNLVIANPHYKDTKLYKSLELKWQATFLQAQKYMLEPKGLEKAQKILFPYRGITQKTPFIQSLLKEYMVYERFKIALANKEYRIVMQHIKLHPFLTEFQEYKEIMNYANSLYMKTKSSLKDGDTHTASKYIKILEDFSIYHDELQEMKKTIKINERFYNAIQTNDKKLAYNILDSTYQFYDTADGKKLQAKFNLDIKKAHIFATKGDIKNLNLILQPYFNIQSRHMALGTIYAYYHFIELENSIKIKKDKTIIKKGILNYIKIFGLQNQIETLYKIFIKQNPNEYIDFNSIQIGSLYRWTPNYIINSIFL